MKKSQRGGRRPGSGRKPGSQNKVTRELKEIAGEYTEAAVKTLVAVMEDPEAPHSARVAAADKLLDRGHGRPTQHVEASLQHDPMNMAEVAKRFDQIMTKARERQRQILIERGLVDENTNELQRH